MTISKKLLLITLLITTTIRPAFMVGFDYKTYSHYVTLSTAKIAATTAQVKIDNPGKSEQKLADLLYPQHKAVLKDIIKSLPAEPDNRISNHYKYEIYKQWKDTFNTNYEESIESGNWNWLDMPMHFAIQE